MDAAIAAAICLGVVGPSSSGLGGGCFILGRTHANDVAFVDAREVAPLAATEDMYSEDPSLSLWGGLAVAVPAELRGLYHAYQLQGGRVPWADLITPSVPLAEEYVISEHLGVHISKMSPEIESDPVLFKEIRSMLTHSDGSYKKGTISHI
jgi:gamma-glutamyltranspeptidase/glutathione hydrolase/leukotriene-C4 hydrolase